MRSSTETKVIVGFACALAVLLAVVAVGYRNSQRLSANQTVVLQSQEVVRSLQAVQNGLIDGENAQRAHAISGDEAAVEAMGRASRQVAGELVQLQEPLDKSPDQNESLNQVK